MTTPSSAARCATTTSSCGSACGSPCPLAVLVAVGFFYLQARKTPIYEADASLQFEKPETVVTSQGVVDPSVRSDTDLNTYIHDINSNKLRTSVIDSFTPDERKILAAGRDEAPAPRRRRRRRSAPSSAPSTPSPCATAYLITISVRHEDPEAAALVANRYVEKFMDYLFESVGGKNEEAVTYLNGRAEQLRKDAEDAEKELQDYMRQHNSCRSTRASTSSPTA